MRGKRAKSIRRNVRKAIAEMRLKTKKPIDIVGTYKMHKKKWKSLTGPEREAAFI